MSHNGQYLIVGSGGGGADGNVYFSKNYGVSWSNITPSLVGLSGSWMASSMSSAGQYIYINDQNGYLYSMQLTPVSTTSILGAISSTGDVSLNQRLFLGSDASLGGNLSIANDMTIGGNLYIKTYTARNMITELSYQLIVAEDISVNGRLFLSNDASINNRLFIGADASFGGKLFTVGDTSLNARLYVGGDVSMQGRLFTVGDTSHNARLYVGSDASINGSLFVNSRTINQGDISANNRLFIGADASFGSRIFAVGDVSFNNRLFVGRDLSVNGNLNLTGNINISQTGTHSITGTLTTSTSVTATSTVTGNETVGGTETITGLLTASGGIVSGQDASLNNRLFVGADASFSSRLFTIGDVSFNNRLYVGLDASFGGNFYVGKNVGIAKAPTYPLDISGISRTSGAVIFGTLPTTKYYTFAGTPSTATITSPSLTFTFGNSSFYAKFNCFLSDASTNTISSVIFDVQGGNAAGTTPSNNIAEITRVSTINGYYQWLAPTYTTTTVVLGTSANTGVVANYSVRVELIQTNVVSANVPTLNSITMVNNNSGGTVVTSFAY